jgi:SAM-dependent methyltransferase
MFFRALANAGRQIPNDVQRLKGSLRRRSPIRQYLQGHSVHKLQIGAGPNELPGWLNADFEPRRQFTIYMDATKPFPFPNNSFDYIFSEHMIEHVPFADALRMLFECHRVLKPGGKIRIATPNLSKIAALATKHPSDEQKRYVAWARANHVEHSVDPQTADRYRPSYVVNNFFWGFGHYFVYDLETLEDAFGAAGFERVTPFAVGVSDDNNLTGLESHASLIGREFNDFETMVVQGAKTMSTAKSPD